MIVPGLAGGDGGLSGRGFSPLTFLRRVRDVRGVAGSVADCRHVLPGDSGRARQATWAGGPQPARNRFIHSAWRCQPAGRCRVRQPRPRRAVRAATWISSRRIVVARALAWRADARVPVARVTAVSVSRCVTGAEAAERAVPPLGTGSDAVIPSSYARRSG